MSQPITFCIPNTYIYFSKFRHILRYLIYLNLLSLPLKYETICHYIIRLHFCAYGITMP